MQSFPTLHMDSEAPQSLLGRQLTVAHFPLKAVHPLPFTAADSLCYGRVPVTTPSGTLCLLVCPRALRGRPNRKFIGETVLPSTNACAAVPRVHEYATVHFLGSTDSRYSRTSMTARVSPSSFETPQRLSSSTQSYHQDSTSPPT